MSNRRWAEIPEVDRDAMREGDRANRAARRLESLRRRQVKGPPLRLRQVVGFDDDTLALVDDLAEVLGGASRRVTIRLAVQRMLGSSDVESMRDRGVVGTVR
ncbi:MAG: hypothetical protein O6758_10205 [Planctomycetota bacterium]|nr:hypothetical protein [Planctomycetota bacterium]